MQRGVYRLVLAAGMILAGCAAVVIQVRREGPSRMEYLTGHDAVPLTTLQLDLWRTDTQNEVAVGAEPFTPALIRANAIQQGSRSGWSAPEIEVQIQRWQPVLVDSNTCFYVKFNGNRPDSSQASAWSLTVLDAEEKSHPGEFLTNVKDERVKYPRLYQSAFNSMVSLASSTFTNAAVGCADKVDLGQTFKLRLDPKIKRGLWPFLLSWTGPGDSERGTADRGQSNSSVEGSSEPVRSQPFAVR